MPFRINWKSTSQWSGTERTEHEGNDEYETLAEAEAARDEMQKDEALMDDVHLAAIEGQGVEGWLEIEEV